jgi:hypothetical protein
MTRVLNGMHGFSVNGWKAMMMMMEFPDPKFPVLFATTTNILPHGTKVSRCCGTHAILLLPPLDSRKHLLLYLFIMYVLLLNVF